jgi:hypothetical protein
VPQTQPARQVRVVRANSSDLRTQTRPHRRYQQASRHGHACAQHRCPIIRAVVTVAPRRQRRQVTLLRGRTAGRRDSTPQALVLRQLASLSAATTVPRAGRRGSGKRGDHAPEAGRNGRDKAWPGWQVHGALVELVGQGRGGPLQGSCLGWSADAGFARWVVVLVDQLGEPLSSSPGPSPRPGTGTQRATRVLLVLGKLREHLTGRTENAATARR